MTPLVDTETGCFELVCRSSNFEGLSGLTPPITPPSSPGCRLRHKEGRARNQWSSLGSSGVVEPGGRFHSPPVYHSDRKCRHDDCYPSGHSSCLRFNSYQLLNKNQLPSNRNTSKESAEGTVLDTVYTTVARAC